MNPKSIEIKAELDLWFDRYNHKNFIAEDPISIPRSFSDRKDIEIAAFFAAIFSWGKRSIIISKCQDLMQRMGGEPFRFVTEANDNDLKTLLGFKHRTFNEVDLLYLVEFLRGYFGRAESLEDIFIGKDLRTGLIDFHEQVFALEYVSERTRKHVSTPVRKSACKRLNMFLRWMVRQDDRGVDFGIWTRMEPSELMIPLDVHVHRVALKRGLMKRKIADWSAVEELTKQLRRFDPSDPVKYDFALFMMGINKLN